MATIHGNLYFLENDSIHAFAQNDIIQQYSQFNFLAFDFFINKEGVKYLSLFNVGILVFKMDGSYQLVKAQNSIGINFAVQAGERWVAGYTDRPDFLAKEIQEKYWSKDQDPPFELYTDTFKQVQGVFHKGSDGSSYWVKRFQNDRLFLFYESYLYEIERNKIIWSAHFPFLSQYKIVREEEDGSIFIGNPSTGGLRCYRSIEHLKTGVYEQFLAGRSPSHILRDHKGGYWIGTADYGVFYCPSFEVKIYDRTASLPIEPESAMTFKNDRELYLGLRNGHVFHLDIISNQLTPLPPAPDAPNIFDMAYDDERQELWIATGAHAYFKNGKWGQVSYQQKQGITNNVFGKRLFLRKGNDVLWGSHSMQFGKIALAQKNCLMNSYDLDIQGRFNAIWEDASGRVWVGMTSGLFEFKDNQLQAPQPFHDAFNSNVEDIAELPDGTLVIGTRGAGVWLWKGDFLHQITTADGLTSDLISNVHVDEKGNIWAGTMAGLNKISKPDAGWRVKQITVQHGLPSNEIHQVRSRNGQVWVATSKGLVRLPEIKSNPDSPAPVIGPVSAGDQLLDLTAPIQLGFSENNVTLHFVAINYHMNGHIPYRFRMDGSYWTTTQNRSVNFPSLSPGQRLFEVQAQNEDGVWSEAAVLHFTVRPPWWKTWWAIALALAVLALAVFGWYKYRTGQLKKEIALQKQLAEVERQALQSQMNPHFLFNALNAIQGYIAEGDKASANRYLSRFSRLVRAALQHSRLTKVPLEDDLRNLQNYLELEQLRFQEKFDYHITVAEDIDPVATTLPPMLVQPFIENAIIHGLANKEGKGQIDLNYRQLDGLLVVTVTDNGIGIQAARQLKKERPSEHQSVGLSITARRLAILNENGNGGKVETEELKDKLGQVTGTRVRVWIPLED